MADGRALFDELLRERPAPGGEGPRSVPSFGSGALRSESLARLLDAAVLVVHALGNLTAVAEEVLVEQRDRLRETPPHERHNTAAAPDEPASTEQINLSY